MFLKAMPRIGYSYRKKTVIWKLVTERGDEQFYHLFKLTIEL